MATTEDLQSRLDDANAALHDLMTGKQKVRVEYQGRMVIYTPANIGALRGYIEELEIALGVKKCRSGATSVWF